MSRRAIAVPQLCPRHSAFAGLSSHCAAVVVVVSINVSSLWRFLGVPNRGAHVQPVTFLRKLASSPSVCRGSAHSSRASQSAKLARKICGCDARKNSIKETPPPPRPETQYRKLRKLEATGNGSSRVAARR